MTKFDKKIDNRYEKELQKAKNFFLNGDYRRAEPLYLKCYKFFKRKNNLLKAYYCLDRYISILMSTDKGIIAQRYIPELFNFAKENNLNDVTAVCLDYQAKITKDSGDLQKSMEYSQKSEEIFRKIGSFRNLEKVISNQGIIFYIQGFYEKALEKFNNALQICRENDIKEDMANIYENISLVYRKLNDHEKFIEYHNKVKEYIEFDKDPQSIAIILNNSILTFKHEDVPTEKYDFLLNALEYCEKYNLIGTQVIVLANLGDILIRRGEFDKAENFLHKALNLCNKYSLNIEKGEVFETLGYLQREKGEINNSIINIKKSIQIARRLNFAPLLIGNYIFLGDLYKEQLDYHESYRYYTQSLLKFRDLSNNLTSIDLKEKFQKNYEDLPKIIEELNNLIESGLVKPNLMELGEIQKTSLEVCKTANIQFKGLVTEDCIKQNKRLKEIINNVKGKQLENDARELFRSRDHYKIETTGKNWNIEPKEIDLLFDQGCIKDKSTKSIEIDIYGKKKLGNNRYYILGECKFKNQPISVEEIKSFLIKANIIATDISKNFRKKQENDPTFKLVIISLGGFPEEEIHRELLESYWKFPKRRLLDKKIELINFEIFLDALKNLSIDTRFYKDLKSL